MTRPYLARKPSSVPWLGDVPAHWDVRRLKTFAADISDLSNERPLNESYIALEHVESWTGEITASSSDVSFDSQVKKFRAGDVLFGKLRPYLAKVARPSCDGYCVGEFLVLRPHNGELLAQYLAKLLRSKPVIDAVNASTFGAKMPRADWHFIGNMVQPLPPLDEQTAIVRYLDDGRAADPGLRERQGEAHRTAGGGEAGHHPPGRHKGPGPHRETEALQRRVAGRRAGTLEPSEVEITSKHQTGGQDTINRLDNGKYPFYVRSQTVERIDTWSYDGEAVLTAGDGVGVGKVFHYAKGKFDYHQRVYKFSDFKDVLGEFFFHYFRTALKNEVFQGTAKSTVDSLRLPMLQNFPITVPPTPEQSVIVQHLEKMNTVMDAAIDCARRQIELMEEYRTRLIADVVTGKLDVRESQTMNETQDPEPIDSTTSTSAPEPGTSGPGTNTGIVYVLENPAMPGYVKLGRTENLT